MKNNLFLDDERFPKDVFWGDIDYNKDEWVIVRNFKEFSDYLHSNEEIPIMISFDNDLQERIEGYDCLKYFLNFCESKGLKKVSKCLFHSKNTVAKENMQYYYKNFVLNYFNA